MNGRPTRIEKPEEGKDTTVFQNHHKQIKVPYVIYADFEALVRTICCCERGEGIKASYTEKKEQHEAYGYSYMIVWSHGEAYGPLKIYRGKKINAARKFLRCILQEGVKTRESLATSKPIVMTAEDWKKHKNATECHICNKSLIKDLFLNSIPVCDHSIGRRKT